MGDEVTGLASLSLADKLAVAPTSLNEGRREGMGELVRTLVAVDGLLMGQKGGCRGAWCGW